MLAMTATSLAIIGSVAAGISVGLLLWSTLASADETRDSLTDAKRDRAAIRTEIGDVRTGMQGGFAAAEARDVAIQSDIGAILAQLTDGAAESAESDNRGASRPAAAPRPAPVSLAAKRDGD